MGAVTLVAAARKRAGLTQQQCADLMEWPLLRWGRKERGETEMEPHEMRLFLHLAGLERIPFRAVKIVDAETS